jgi:deoxycytidylate deaminase
MSSSPLTELVTHPEPELVLGIVCPVGVNQDAFEKQIIEALSRFQYRANTLRVSRFVEALNTEFLGLKLDLSSPGKRIDSLMTAGNRLRAAAKRGDILALYAIAEINRNRKHTDKDPLGEPYPRTVHIIRSFKHPDEVEAFRRIYGPGFFLVAVGAPLEKRMHYLTRLLRIPVHEAEALIRRDEREQDDFGQQTRDTFTLADVFLQDGQKDQLERFIDLLFGEPFTTPTPDEHAMFLAYAASLRSAQLARQVGAVVVSPRGEVIASGANEVPKYGGGQYWPGPGDHRDHVQGFDSNDEEIQNITDDVLKKLDALISENRLPEARQRIASSRIADLTEFGRVVHAEMEALSACARIGSSTIGCSMYVTTFPCHNCAKHIVAAGIERVIFVEPYPKSLATTLHDDSIAIDDEEAKDKVRFLPFVGVAARRYFDLFSMRLSSGLPLKRKKDRRPIPWDRRTALPRVRMSPWGYIAREDKAIGEYNAAMEAIEQTNREDPQ